VTSPSEEPAWKQRAVERSIKTAKLRAAQRVQRFLDAAQAIIIEKGSTDFTVQEVVDRSRQSLRSFYLQFDGKHELLLALFEDALSRSADQIRSNASKSPSSCCSSRHDPTRPPSGRFSPTSHHACWSRILPRSTSRTHRYWRCSPS
jgi:AcrR family transcriptional regulator